MLLVLFSANKQYIYSLIEKSTKNKKIEKVTYVIFIIPFTVIVKSFYPLAISTYSKNNE